ncbi:MAG: FecR family protein [Pedobacter sp.]|nr:MAG: FecR family protein [Pedobacter sp.]
MNKKEAQQLIDRYLAGHADARERALVERWYERKSAHERLRDADAFEHLADELWTGTKLRAGINIVQDTGITKSARLWRQVAVAAAAVAAITLGTWLYVNELASSRNASRNDEVVVNDIAPGRNTATLTLPNGKTIKLSDAKTGLVIGDKSLTYTDGSSLRGAFSDEAIFSNNDVMLTATTPRGGTYQVTLPDGTRVWLNADSKISFPSQFTGKQRKVLMEGEAYFEVAKLTRSSLRGRSGTLQSGSNAVQNGNERVPFIVETKRQTIEVLGTHFNVTAYADEHRVMTTLLEGKVKVIESGDSMTLAPGEQAYSDGDGLRGLKTDDLEAVIAWKNGQFMFTDEDLQSIMRKVARWYDVEVVYEKGFQNRGLVGTISKFENVSKVLKMLELTGTVRFKVEGRRITVMK